MYLPYQISHIRLDKNPARPALTVSGQGNYLVFWWKEVALGHLYVDPQENLPEDQYYRKLTKAIGAAVVFQAKQQPAGHTEWENWLHNRKFDEWTEWMGRVFSPATQSTIPASVPVSLIICTRNRPDDLRNCLDAIDRMVCQPGEIIVVDNARENDNTEKLIAAYANPRIRYCHEPSAGLSYARNTGVLNASQPVIAFTDDDVTVHPLWIFRIWETFRKSSASAITGLVIASELESETQLIFEKFWSFNRGYADILFDTDFLQKTLSIGPPVWDIGAGANMAFRKEIFDEVGLFDVRLGAGASGCSEDSEMWYRILLKGHSILYTPAPVVFHRHRQDFKSLYRQMYSYMRGFAAAALIQQEQHQEAGYRRHLFGVLPKYYCVQLFRGFPFYRSKFRTVGAEVRGIISGLVFYSKNRNRTSRLI